MNPRKYWVLIAKQGDSYFTEGSAVPYEEFEEERKKVLDRGGKPPTIRIRFEEPPGNGNGKLLPALKPFDPYKFADYVLRNNVFSDADTFIYSGLSGTNPHAVPDHIWAESLATMGGEFVKTGDLYVVKTPGVERPPDMRARPTWREVTPLMSTEPDLNASTINLLATTEGDPIRKFCCRQCGECAPAELLEEGKFPERIDWLRHHYKEKHPGMWGKIQPAVIPTKEPWQMTLEEYAYAEASRYGHGKPRMDWIKAGYGETYRSHKTAVQRALKEGKAVPLEVLKDYPELVERKSMTVIPAQPSPPSPKQELEFVSDSPEYLAFTIDDIGYREKLDTAFETAIARAKGG